jgi:hypothetical protein
MGISDFFGKAKDVMVKQMEREVKNLSVGQLKQLTKKGNPYAAEELRRRGVR